MIMQINGPSTVGKIQLHRVLQRSLLWGVIYTQVPLPGQRSTHFIQLDSCANPPFPYVVVTATRNATSHTFIVQGDRWAEQTRDVLLTLFPELERPPKRFFNPVLHPERYAAHLRRKHGR